MSKKKTDRLDYMVETAFAKYGDPDVALYESLDTSETVLDGEFYEKQTDAILANHASHSKKMFRLALRIVAAAAAVIAVASITVLALRNDDTSDIAQPTIKLNDSTMVVIGFETPKGDEEEEKKESQTKIESIVFPDYTPEGYKISHSTINDISVLVSYDESVNGGSFAYMQTLLSDDRVIHTDNPTITETTIRGYKAEIISGESGDVYVIWSDGKYTYSVEGTQIDLEELLKIARSVPPC